MIYLSRSVRDGKISTGKDIVLIVFYFYGLLLRSYVILCAVTCCGRISYQPTVERMGGVGSAFRIMKC